MNKTQKIFIILIILLSSLVLYLFLWYFSLSSPSSSFLTLIPFPNDLIKSTTKNNQTNLVQKENNQPTTNQPTANQTSSSSSSSSPSSSSSSSSSANLTNLPQYPVDPLIKEKLTQAGLNPLYQLVKEDRECRSVVFEGREKKAQIEDSVIVNIEKIPEEKQSYYITIKKIKSGEILTFRFDPEFTSVYLDDMSFSKEKSFYIEENGYQKLNQNVVLDLLSKNQLFKINDFIQASYIYNDLTDNFDPNNFEKDNNGFFIAGTIIIRRCNKI